MIIELEINGEKKLFSADYTPMLAKRKYYELKTKNPPSTHEELLADDDAHVAILADIVFKGQFTIMQAYEGASEEYILSKLREAVFGIQKETVSNEGNHPGE